MLSLLDLAAILLTLSALFGWLNHKFLPLPHTIGLLLMSVVTSLVLVLVDVAFPEQHLFAPLTAALLQIDFSAVVMNGMLAFLLFAGTLHVDLGKLRSRAFPVALLATLGTIISTVLVGAGIWELARLLGNPMPLPWALVFGALISPTDPVAVLSTLKNVKVPPSLEVEMQGEALFNDGVGIVLFGSDEVVCSLSLLIFAGHSVPAVRQKLHLSPCSDSRGRLSRRPISDFSFHILQETQMPMALCET